MAKEDDELLADVEAEDEEDVIQDTDLEVEDEGDEESEQGSKLEEKSQEPETKEQYSARVRRRMDQLLKDRKEEREARQAVEHERDSMRQELDELRKEHFEARKKAIQVDMRKAYEDDDEDARWRLNEELIDLRVRQGEQPRQESRQQESRQQAQATEPPAARWVAKNQSWFERDPGRLEAAKRIEKELQAEGYTTDDHDLYDELDRRLDEEGITTVADAQTSRRTDNVTGANPTRREATPPPSTRNRVRLDREDRRHMEELGLDWDNMDHRKEWLSSKRELAAARRR